MANTITRTVLLDNAIQYVCRLDIVGDGSGEETGTRVNVATGDMSTSNAISHVTGALSGFSARLLFDATTDVLASVQIPSDQPIDWDFMDFGGIKNNSGSGKTGDVLITTAGLGNGDSGSIILTVKKK